MTKRLVFSVAILSSISGTALAIEEDNTRRDVGLATVWAVGQFTQGGYIKTGINATIVDDSAAFLGEMEGGWRFTERFSLGMNLRASFSKIDSLDDKLYQVGFVAGWRSNTGVLRPYVVDFKTGSVDVGSAKSSSWFYEVGITFIRHLTKINKSRINYGMGLNYRYVESESFDLFGQKGLSGLGLSLNAVIGKY